MMAKNEGLKVNVSITDTEVFSDMLAILTILTDMFADERIEKSIKEPYKDRIEEIIVSSGYYQEKKEGEKDEQ